MKKSWLAVLFGCLTACSAPSGETSQKVTPNILWIFVEDLSPFLGCYGDSINQGHTPTLDQLASEGVLFERVYATAPVCSPSRSAIITGKMQTTTGTHNHRSSRAPEGDLVPEEEHIYLPPYIEQTIPELMKAAGYFTFNNGKDDYNFHYDRRALYEVGTEAGYQAGMNGWQGNHAAHYLSITQDVWNARPDKSQPWFGQIELKGGKAKDEYVRQGEKLATNEVPLPPYFPAVPSQREAWTAHYNANRGTDAQVEEILEQLRIDGELKNTIIFFFSDHGSNTSLRHKQFCYEGGLHVPLIIHGKHPLLQAGTRRSELVSTLDISATTLAMGGAALPEYLDGDNLFAEDYRPRAYVIGARDRCDFTIDHIRTVRSDTFRYIRNYFPDRPLMQAGYRDGQPMVKDMHRLHAEGKLTPYQEAHWFGTRPEEELYDLANDPDQIHNLANDPAYADTLKRHREILSNWIEETDDQGQYPEPERWLKGTYELWKERPVFKEATVNPEYAPFMTD
jgi:arylsulfatase A-like enzyme